jgi:chemosensory pili system protein ChpA (sensor histidine kinase/response regulator)
LFIETIDEYLESVDSAMSALREGDSGALRSLRNTLHTVKGAANSIGLRKLGALVHEFEDRLGDIEHAGDVGSSASIHKIDALVDGLNEAAEFVRRRKTDWDPTVTEASEFMPAVAEDDEPITPPVADVQIDDAGSERRVNTLRIETHRIDRLLDIGLEISMSNVRCRHALDAAQQDRNEVQGLARRVQTLVDKLSLQLDTEIQAKTESLSSSEQFDPLEMDRMTEKQSLAAILREAAYDLQEEAGSLGTHLDAAMREGVGSSRLLQSNQSDLRMLRLVNFSKLGPGLRRLVHQVSRQLGKHVEFDFTCSEGGLDISVFEQLRIALEHMLRNAIDHGIGKPEERIAQGKAESGNIKLLILRQGSEFVIRLLDDGNGIEPELVRKKAIEQALVGEQEQFTDDEALRLIFRAGLSTAGTVTDVSGRGVGMDVVYQSVTQVGGSIEVQSKAGFYTQFDIRVPASIMVNGALLASIGEEQVAVPLTSLEGSDFRRRDDIHREASVADGRITFRDEEYQLRYLGTVRGGLPVPGLDVLPEFVPVLFAKLDRRRVAFFVDALDNAEEMVIRSLGAQFTGVPGIAGGAVKSDGQPVLALDLNEFIGQVDYADEVVSVAIAAADNTTLILCVDDSVMMRRTYEKRLQSLGYKVATAVDGEDALDYLSQAGQMPDFIFTDLEMPNMNGFDFIANLRRVPAYEHIPTVVVSSRDAEKHRSEATRVGATDFMAKGANSADGMRAVIQRHLTDNALAS